MKIRIFVTAVFLTFGIAFAQQQLNNRLWKRTLSLSRNVNRSSSSPSSSLLSSSSLGASSRLKAVMRGQTIHQGTIPGLTARRQVMAAPVVNSLVPFAKPLPPATAPEDGNIWVKVYGEANANKSNERLLDVQAHTEILHFVHRTPAPRHRVEESQDLSLSGYGPPPEEPEVTVVDQQAGVSTEAQSSAAPEIENPYGGGAPVATEPKQTTAKTGRTVGGPSTVGHAEETGLPSATEAATAAAAATGPSKAATTPSEGTTEAGERTTGLTGETTEGVSGASEVAASPRATIETSSVPGPTEGESTAVTTTSGRAGTVLETGAPSGAGVGGTEAGPTGSTTGLFTYGSSSATTHPATEPTNLATGPQDFGYGGGPEITEERPSTAGSSVASPVSQLSTISEEKPTVAIGTRTPSYGTLSTPAAGEKIKGTEQTPGSSEAPHGITEAFSTSQGTASVASTSAGREGTSSGTPAESTPQISTEETAGTAAQTTETVPGYGSYTKPESTTGVTELGTGLPGLSREPAKQLTKSIEEATSATPEEGAGTETGRPEGTTGFVTPGETKGPTGGVVTPAEGVTTSGTAPESTKAGEVATELPGTTATGMTTSYGTEAASPVVERTGPSEAATAATGATELPGRVTGSTEISTRPLESGTRTTAARREEGTTEAGVGTGGGLAGYGEEVPSGAPEFTEETSSTSSHVTETGFAPSGLPQSTEETSAASESTEETTRPTVYSYETTVEEESTEGRVTEAGKQPLSTEIPATAEETTIVGVESTETSGPTPSGGPTSGRTSETPEFSKGVPSVPGEGTTGPGEETISTVSEEATSTAGKAPSEGFAETSGVTGTPGATAGITGEGTLEAREETSKPGSTLKAVTGPEAERTESPLPGGTVTRPSGETIVSGLLESTVSGPTVPAGSTTIGKLIGATEGTATLRTESTNLPTGPEEFGYGGGREEVTAIHPGTGRSALPPGQKPTEAIELTSTISGPTASEGITTTTGLLGSAAPATGPTEGAETSRRPSEGIPATESTEGVPEYGTTAGVLESTENTVGTTGPTEASSPLPEYSTESAEGTTEAAATPESTKETPVSEETVGLPGLTGEERTSIESTVATGTSAGPTVSEGKKFTGAGAPGSTPPSQTETAKIPSGPEDFGYGGGKEEATEARPSSHPSVAATSTLVPESSSVTAAEHPGAETTFESTQRSSQAAAEAETSASEEAGRGSTTSGIPTYSASVEERSTSGSTERSTQYPTEASSLQSSETYVTSTEGETASLGISEETAETGTTKSAETILPSTVAGQTSVPGETSLPTETETTEEITGTEEVATESNLVTSTKESGVESTSGLPEQTSSPERPSQSTESIPAATVQGITKTTGVSESVSAKIPMGPEDFGYGGGNEITAGTLTSGSSSTEPSLLTTRQAEVPVSTGQTNLVETSVAPESTSAGAEYTGTPEEHASASETGSTAIGTTEPSSAPETVPTLGAATVPFAVTHELSTALEEGGSSTTTVPATTGTEIVHTGENIPANIPTGPEDFGYGGGPTEPSSAAAASASASSSSFPSAGPSSQFRNRMSLVSDTGTGTNELPELHRPKKVFSSLPLEKVDDSTKRKWKPYTLDCNVEVDEKGELCREWAKGGLCETHRPTMFLFCRRTCLCVGPPMDLRRRLLRL